MTASRLYRFVGLAGLGCALLLFVNSARRGGILPENGLTHAIAPFGALLGLFALTGLYLYQRAEAGRLGAVGFALNAAGLAGAFAIEYSIHFVFPYLGKDQVTSLVEGSTGRAFLVTAVVLITGVVLFGIASWRAGRLPAAAVGLYVIGMIPGSLRSAVPVPVYLLGLVVAAIGVAWMSVPLLRSLSAPAPTPAASLA
jgi:hypothetical protein